MKCENCGHEPHYKTVERQQEPYRGMWQALIAWERDMMDAGNPIYPNDLRRKITEIAGDRPAPLDAFALSTTRYGREELDGN